jgi:hypothetical protein
MRKGKQGTNGLQKEATGPESGNWRSSSATNSGKGRTSSQATGLRATMGTGLYGPPTGQIQTESTTPDTSSAAVEGFVQSASSTGSGSSEFQLVDKPDTKTDLGKPASFLSRESDQTMIPQSEPYQQGYGYPPQQLPSYQTAFQPIMPQQSPYMGYYQQPIPQPSLYPSAPMLQQPIAAPILSQRPPRRQKPLFDEYYLRDHFDPSVVKSELKRDDLKKEVTGTKPVFQKKDGGYKTAAVKLKSFLHATLEERKKMMPPKQGQIPDEKLAETLNEFFDSVDWEEGDANALCEVYRFFRMGNQNNYDEDYIKFLFFSAFQRFPDLRGSQLEISTYGTEAVKAKKLDDAIAKVTAASSNGANSIKRKINTAHQRTLVLDKFRNAFLAATKGSGYERAFNWRIIAKTDAMNSFAEEFREEIMNIHLMRPKYLQMRCLFVGLTFFVAKAILEQRLQCLGRTTLWLKGLIAQDALKLAKDGSISSWVEQARGTKSDVKTVVKKLTMKDIDFKKYTYPKELVLLASYGINPVLLRECKDYDREKHEGDIRQLAFITCSVTDMLRDTSQKEKLEARKGKVLFNKFSNQDWIAIQATTDPSQRYKELPSVGQYVKIAKEQKLVTEEDIKNKSFQVRFNSASPGEQMSLCKGALRFISLTMDNARVYHFTDDVFQARSRNKKMKYLDTKGLENMFTSK